MSWDVPEQGGSVNGSGSATRWLPALGGEVQRRAPLYVRELIAQVDRKNGWQRADDLGDEPCLRWQAPGTDWSDELLLAFCQ